MLHAVIRSQSAASGATANFAHADPWFVYSIQVEQYCGKSLQNASSNQIPAVFVSCC